MIENFEEICIGQIVAAPFPDDDSRHNLEYYRSKIIEIQEQKDIIKVSLDHFLSFLALQIVFIKISLGTFH